MQPSMLQVRPPYVSFETRVIDRYQPKEEGGMLYKVEQDWVKVTPQGSKDILEKAAEDWFINLRMKVDGGMEHPQILADYERQYEAFKQKKTLPLNGTSIKNWPIATMAQVQLCIGLNLLTVEDLANCSAEAVSRLGMGAQILRNRAVEWLKAQTDTGPLVMRLESMESMMTEMGKQLKELREENAFLRSTKGVPLMGDAPSEMNNLNLNADGADSSVVDRSIDAEINAAVN